MLQSSQFFQRSKQFIPLRSVFVLPPISELVFVVFQLPLMDKRRPWITPQVEDVPLIT